MTTPAEKFMAIVPTMLTHLTEVELRTVQILAGAQIAKRMKVPFAPPLPVIPAPPVAPRFRIGHRVAFNDRVGMPTQMTVTRVNHKSLSGIEDSGKKWRVHPGFCKLATPSEFAAAPVIATPSASSAPLTKREDSW